MIKQLKIFSDQVKSIASLISRDEDISDYLSLIIMNLEYIEHYLYCLEKSISQKEGCSFKRKPNDRRYVKNEYSPN